MHKLIVKALKNFNGYLEMFYKDASMIVCLELHIKCLRSAVSVRLNWVKNDEPFHVHMKNTQKQYLSTF